MWKLVLAGIIILMAQIEVSASEKHISDAVLTDVAIELESAGAVCQSSAYSFVVFVKNVKSDTGIITIDIHDNNADAFLKPEGLINRVHIPAAKGSTVACIGVETAGTYALAVYHDKNTNRKFDKNWLGLPSEPYGISNDPPIRLGPPPHRLAAIEIFGPNTPVTVTLKN